MKDVKPTLAEFVAICEEMELKKKNKNLTLFEEAKYVHQFCTQYREFVNPELRVNQKEIVKTYEKLEKASEVASQSIKKQIHSITLKVTKAAGPVLEPGLLLAGAASLGCAFMPGASIVVIALCAMGAIGMPSGVGLMKWKNSKEKKIKDLQNSLEQSGIWMEKLKPLIIDQSKSLIRSK